jgi:hypothetical protein
MLRTIFTIGLFALFGLIALRLAFGVAGFLLGALMWVAVWAVKIGLVVAAGYVVLRIVSPDTARQLRDRWSGRA